MLLFFNHKSRHTFTTVHDAVNELFDAVPEGKLLSARRPPKLTINPGFNEFSDELLGAFFLYLLLFDVTVEICRSKLKEKDIPHIYHAVVDLMDDVIVGQLKEIGIALNIVRRWTFFTELVKEKATAEERIALGIDSDPNLN